MGILYVITVIALLTAFVLIKKTEKELNLISFIGIGIVLLLCYNAFICYMLTFFAIPITIFILSIINLGFTALMFAIIIRKKEIQKYKVDKMGIISTLIILVVTVSVAILNFGFPFNIKYESGDAPVHYLTSSMFAEQETLLSISIDEIYSTFQGRKIASYTNSGIIMKCLDGVIDEINYYQVFIGFGVFILFITGSMMYNTLEKFTKNKYTKILALIVSLIFVLGYPLNSLIFGFEYLSLGILIICTIVHIIYYFEKEELKKVYNLIIFALLNFGIFCSYYLFVPFVYSALWIYFCAYSYRKNKKIICKENIQMLVITLLVPFFLGFIYHLAPAIYCVFNSNMEETKRIKDAMRYNARFSSNILNNSFKLNGYIYINYYSNMILLIPLAIYHIIQKIKKKEIFSFDILLLVILLIYMGILFVGLLTDNVSAYFTMKNYFALWIILIYMNFKSLMNLYDKNKAFPYTIVRRIFTNNYSKSNIYRYAIKSR